MKDKNKSRKKKAEEAHSTTREDERSANTPASPRRQKPVKPRRFIANW